MSKTIYILNGPNLNLLGARQPEIYGRATLADVEKLCRAAGDQHGLAVEFRQSNHEGQIIDWIQEARAQKAAGLIINPAGYTHTSVAILDALYDEFRDPNYAAVPLLRRLVSSGQLGRKTKKGFYDYQR